MDAPVFYLDYNSPYAYLAAERLDDAFPGTRWRPIAFGILIRAIGKTPWSFDARGERAAGLEEIARRARERGLPPVVYPEGWPVGSYSLLPLRAAIVAEERGLVREFSRAVFRICFAEGRRLDDLDALLDAALVAGVDADDVRRGVEDPVVKDRLRAYTDDAIARGVTGVPTVQVAGELFWGDDRLEDARTALSGR